MYLELLFGKRTLSLFSAVAVGALLLSSSAHADVTVEHDDRGAFNSGQAYGLLMGVSKFDDGSYGVSNLNVSGVASATRNYHVFDLSGYSGTATSATLELNAAVYQSFNSLGRDVLLHSVSTSADDLLAADPEPTTYDSTIFDDLGTGTPYGTLTVTPGDAGNFVSVLLNASALADINAAIASGSWAVGGALTTSGSGTAAPGFPPSGFPGEGLFTGSAAAPDARLVLTGVVPEPTSVLLMLLAIGGAATCGGRRR